MSQETAEGTRAWCRKALQHKALQRRGMAEERCKDRARNTAKGRQPEAQEASRRHRSQKMGRHYRGWI